MRGPPICARQPRQSGAARPASPPQAMHSDGTTSSRTRSSIRPIVMAGALPKGTALRQSATSVNHAPAHYHWTFAFPILVPITAFAWLYLRRYFEVRRASGPRGAGARQMGAFIAAIAVILIALVSPLDRLGEDYLFSAHMVQHLLLGDIAPLLVLLSLSRVIMRPLTRRLQTLERALGPLAHPASALVLWLGLVYLWHVPALYDAALNHSAVHAIQHVSFFTAGVLVWWPLIQPVPMRNRLAGMWTFGYLGAAKLGLASLGLFLTWTSTVAYTYYEHVPRI